MRGAVVLTSKKTPPPGKRGERGGSQAMNRKYSRIQKARTVHRPYFKKKKLGVAVPPKSIRPRVTKDVYEDPKKSLRPLWNGRTAREKKRGRRAKGVGGGGTR